MGSTGAGGGSAGTATMSGAVGVPGSSTSSIGTSTWSSAPTPAKVLCGGSAESCGPIGGGGGGGVGEGGGVSEGGVGEGASVVCVPPSGAASARTCGERKSGGCQRR